MLEFRLRQPLVFPAGRRPRVNRAHPLFNPQHFTHCAVANGGSNVNGQGSLVDLLSGAIGTNTTTLGGVDKNGPYVWSNDSAGTAAISMSGPATSFNFTCWGIIFQLNGTNRQYIWAVSTNTGFWSNGLNINFELSNGSQASFNGIAGHTYFLFMNNAPGTASQQRTMVGVDLDTGKVFMFQNLSSGNVVLNPISALEVSSGVCTNRLYASFCCGSSLVPPAVTPPATFYSIDQIMGGIKDPWGLWYG